jgi:hypothetical protein
MMASRLYHRRHVIPAMTGHLEDEGGVIGVKDYDKTRPSCWPKAINVTVSSASRVTRQTKAAGSGDLSLKKAPAVSAGAKSGEGGF